MSKELTEKYEKGYSPSALQRKYSLSYVQGYELAQQFKQLQEQLKEANAIIKDMRPFIQGSMKRETFTRILHYEEKWGVK